LAGDTHARRRGRSKKLADTTIADYGGVLFEAVTRASETPDARCPCSTGVDGAKCSWSAASSLPMPARV